MSRSVWLKGDAAREEAPNDGTLNFAAARLRFDALLPIDPPPSIGAPFPTAAPTHSFEDLFRRHYPNLRELLNRHRAPGLGLLVVSGDGLEGTAWFEAREDDANPLILGRHTSAEIFLPSDPRLSLRHLALVLHRRTGSAPVRFCVLDLRTSAAFADENGRAREAIESAGPVMIRCASFALLLFPTDAEDAPWPEEVDAAWKRVPERLYFDPRAGDPRSVRPAPDRELPPAELAEPWADRGPDVGSITLVPTLPGPVFPSRDLALSDPPQGELVVRSSSGRVSLRLGVSAARRGVLLGRYERCETSGLPVLSNPSLSRVHLLVIELDGALYAVDTASTNGSYLGEVAMRCARLRPGLRVRLAHDATVEWRPFH